MELQKSLNNFFNNLKKFVAKEIPFSVPVGTRLSKWIQFFEQISNDFWGDKLTYDQSILEIPVEMKRRKRLVLRNHSTIQVNLINCFIGF